MTLAQQLERLEELRREIPPGAWRWRLNPAGKSVQFGTMRHIAMDFARYGMVGASPRFPVDGIMKRADALTKPVPGYEHHADWKQLIDHPVAEYIELCCKALPDLLAHTRALEERNKVLEAEREDLRAQLDNAIDRCADLAELAAREGVES